MQGLLRKDLYMAKSYLRTTAAAIAVFLVLGALMDGLQWYFYTAILIAGLVPVSMLSYDEAEKWPAYADTLPVTAKHLVMEKYLLGLLFSAAGTILSTFSAGINAALHPGVPFSPLTTAGVFFCMSLMGSVLLLPVIFKFGREKGRILYYLLFGLLFGVAGAFGMFNKVPGMSGLDPVIGIPVVAILWVLSLGLSIRMYEKREF